jgi:uncharacterized protein YggL (DUF469 family)
MAYNKWKLEAGHGGRLGHTNMAHWDYTEAIKDCSKVNRRLESKKILGHLELESTEIEVYIILKTIEEFELNTFYDSFIQFIEHNKFFFGGGIREFKIEGCIDFSASKLEKDQVIKLIDQFVDNHLTKIQKLTLKSNNI